MKTIVILVFLVLSTGAAVLCQVSGQPPAITGDNFGVLSNPGAEFIVLMSDGGAGRFVARSTGKRLKLPPGKYVINGIILQKNDRQGREWTIRSKPFSAPPSIEITKGRILENSLGEPFVATVVRKQESLEISLKGRQGEEYDYFSVKGQRIDPPSFTITGPDGRQIESGKFEYG